MNRLNILPEDVARLVWRGVFDEVIKEIPNAVYDYYDNLSDLSFENKTCMLDGLAVDFLNENEDIYNHLIIRFDNDDLNISRYAPTNPHEAIIYYIVNTGRYGFSSYVHENAEYEAFHNKMVFADEMLDIVHERYVQYIIPDDETVYELSDSDDDI